MSFSVLRSLILFVIAGLAEIGGGTLVWQLLREGKALWFGFLGGMVLIIYGVIPTFQTESTFGRVYAAYGGHLYYSLNSVGHDLRWLAS